MAEKKKKFIDDGKMTDFINKNWAEYQRAQKSTGSKATSSGTKKKVKRK